MDGGPAAELLGLLGDPGLDFEPDGRLFAIKARDGAGPDPNRPLPAIDPAEGVGGAGGGGGGGRGGATGATVIPIVSAAVAPIGSMIERMT